MFRFSTIIAAFVAGALTGTNAQTIEEIAGGNADLSTLVTLLELGGFAPNGPLGQDGDYLVFAPTNAAFDALGSEVVEKYTDPKWNMHLQDVLLYHVAVGAIFSSAIPVGDTPVPMLNGENVTVNSDGTTVTVTYPAANSTTGSATVVLADVNATNGVAHVVDAVLLPEHAFTTIASAAASGGLGDNYTTIVELVQPLLGLAPAGPITVLAPSDAAFEALGQETIDQLLCPENSAALQTVLLGHVLGDVYSSNALPDDGSTVDIPTMAGTTVAASKSNGIITFNTDIVVVDEDFLTSDGVVHGLDGVILPADFQLAPCGTGTDGVIATGPPDTSMPVAPGTTMAPTPAAAPTTDAPVGAPTTASPVAAGSTTAPSAAPDSGDDSAAPMFGASIFAIGAGLVVALL